MKGKISFSLLLASTALVNMLPVFAGVKPSDSNTSDNPAPQTSQTSKAPPTNLSADATSNTPKVTAPRAAVTDLLPVGIKYEVSVLSTVTLPKTTESLVGRAVPVSVFAIMTNTTDKAVSWSAPPSRLHRWELSNSAKEIVDASPRRKFMEPGLSAFVVTIPPHRSIDYYQIVPVNYAAISKGGSYRINYMFWGAAKTAEFIVHPEQLASSQ